MAATQTLEPVHKPVFRMFPVEVARVRRLGPSFIRLTFTSECLRDFGTSGVDQRIKLVLPQPGRTLADFPDAPDWHHRWLALPEHIRPRLRTYTVRAYRPETAELDVDFVLHGGPGHGGPASNWAAVARPGEVVGLVGPDRSGTGRMWGCEWSPPPTAGYLVLAGDETAVPAVAAIVETLPSDARGVVCLEVPYRRDRQEWNVPEGVSVQWLPRCSARAPHGELLTQAVATALDELRLRPHGATPALEDVDVDAGPLWEVPRDSAAPGYLYGWLAGEAGVIKHLRRMLVRDYGIPKQSVAFMGYWREGLC